MINIGPLELIIIFIVALLVIGPKKLPELARALGRALGEFKKATDELRTNLDIDFNSIDAERLPSNEPSAKNSKDEPGEPKKEETLPTKEKNVNDQ